jgi:hypothetical protein
MLGSVLCRVLPAAHALTGCDTTSSFFGVGKKTIYKVLKDSRKEFVDLSQISCDDIETSVAVGRKFVARLYHPKARFTCDHGDLNKLRSRIAQQKDASLVKLPPCEATLRQHVLRVSLQVYIWTSSSIAQPPVKSPLQFGWVNKNGLVPVYFDGQTSSDFLHDLLCTCKGKTLCSKGCVCFEQDLSCTELCPCQGNFSCNNSYTHTFTDDSDEEVDT